MSGTGEQSHMRPGLKSALSQGKLPVKSPVGWQKESEAVYRRTLEDIRASRQSKVSSYHSKSSSASQRRSTTFAHYRPSALSLLASKRSGTFNRPSSVPDVDTLVKEMGGAGQISPELTDFKALTEYFMGFWKASHAASALTHLEKMEVKRTIRDLQKRHGFWMPPPEVVEALTKNPPPDTVSNLPPTKEARNLKFALKILGCSLHEDKPYKQFLSAKTLRQKRYWLYKYQGPKRDQDPNYVEPVCTMRLKRLYRFFPDRFTERDGFMYFNDKIILYDQSKDLFYIVKEVEEE